MYYRNKEPGIFHLVIFQSSKSQTLLNFITNTILTFLNHLINFTGRQLSFQVLQDKVKGELSYLLTNLLFSLFRITGFDASPSKNPDKNTTVLAQLEKLEKYKALKRESSTKEMKELEQSTYITLKIIYYLFH